MAEETEAPGGDEVLELARERFAQAVEAEDKNRDKQRDDMKFLASTPDDNFQWPTNILNQRQEKGQYGGPRPCLTINKLRPHQNQVLNEQRMNRPQIRVKPGDSRASREVAKALNGWMRHIQVASEADLAYDQACTWQTGAGEGFFRLFTDFASPMSFEQDVLFAPLPDRFKVYLDPIGLKQHPAGKKCRWGFIIEDLPKSEYESIYGETEAEAIDWNLAGSGDQAKYWFPTKDSVRVAEYFEIEMREKTICEWEVPEPAKLQPAQPAGSMPSAMPTPGAVMPGAQPAAAPMPGGQPPVAAPVSGAQPLAGDPAQMAAQPAPAPQPQAEPKMNRVVTVKGSPEDLNYQKAGYEKTNERVTKIPRCIWRKMNGQKVIGKSKEMPTSHVPIVRVVGNEFVIDGELLIDGMVRPAKDAQRTYNYNVSKEAEANALQPLSPITAMVDQMKGHEAVYEVANRLPVAFLPYNAVFDDQGNIVNVAPPARLAPPAPPLAFIQAKIGADQDIKATMGQWGPSLGEPSGEKSGKAINARKNESDVGNFHYIDNLRRSLRYAGIIALEMGAEIIVSRQLVRILGEDGEPDHIVVDPDQTEPYKETVGPDGKKVKSYNFNIGRYEVEADTGPNFTTRRTEAADFLTSAVQSAKDPATANVLTYLAMKNQDWSGAEEAVTLLKSLLPQPAQQALAQDQEQEPLPPEAQAQIDQMKQMIGHLKGQLDASKQALIERDQTLKANEAELKGKNRDALARMYEADKKAMSEMVKARADVEIAKVDALTAMAKDPGNETLKALGPVLDKLIAEMNEKINALAQSTNGIAQQLQNFEVAANMPAQAPA